MLRSLALSIAQLSDPKIVRILIKSISLTLALFLILGISTFFGLDWLLAYYGWHEGAMAAAALATIITVFVAVLLFRIIAIFVLNIFADDIIDAIEKRHYPSRAESARPPGYIGGLKLGLASAGRAIGYNLVASPIYIMLIITGIGAPIVFFAVNALLIGRDLQDMIASRHYHQMAKLTEMWRLPVMQRFLLGLLAAIMLVVPIVNFLAPILAVAMATHLVHRKAQGA